MQSLANHILALAATLPEGQPLAAKGLLHLGERRRGSSAVTARQARTSLAGGTGPLCLAGPLVLPHSAAGEAVRAYAVHMNDRRLAR